MKKTNQTRDQGKMAAPKPKLRIPPIKRQKTLPEPPPAIGRTSSRVAFKPKLRTPPIKLQKTLPALPPRLGDKP